MSGILFGLLGYLGVSIMQLGFSPDAMLGWRFFVASVSLAPLALMQMKRLDICYKSIFKTFLYSSILYSGSTYLYFIASEYIGTGLAMVIFFTYPIIVVMISWFYNRQKIGGIYFYSLVLIIVGLFCLIQNENVMFNLKGLGLAFGSAIFFAIYMLVAKKDSANIPAALSTFFTVSGSCFLFFVAAVAQDTFILPTSYESWFYIIVLGLVSTTFPILLLLKSMVYISANRASILSVLEPVSVLIVGVLFLNEPINLIQCIGTALILLSAILVQFTN